MDLKKLRQKLIEEQQRVADAIVAFERLVSNTGGGKGRQSASLKPKRRQAASDRPATGPVKREART